ncbi:hypothetical protein N7537_002077 [Penicillium hordei]|uniref:Uncharacterized protein n=1 Tax=Penicillium hordei TaxID=40994 RepID=A0AAD6H7I6_9EURO|nr:uncharacterized protein N7537_002077 [Penicillium hordei]KAJ5616963.1 hypothetical protein N7537_002077 [Penicillium hordei]
MAKSSATIHDLACSHAFTHADSSSSIIVIASDSVSAASTRFPAVVIADSRSVASVVQPRPWYMAVNSLTSLWSDSREGGWQQGPFNSEAG